MSGAPTSNDGDETPPRPSAVKVLEALLRRREELSGRAEALAAVRAAQDVKRSLLDVLTVGNGDDILHEHRTPGVLAALDARLVRARWELSELDALLERVVGRMPASELDAWLAPDGKPRKHPVAIERVIATAQLVGAVCAVLEATKHTDRAAAVSNAAASLVLAARLHGVEPPAGIEGVIERRIARYDEERNAPRGTNAGLATLVVHSLVAWNVPEEMKQHFALMTRGTVRRRASTGAEKTAPKSKAKRDAR